MQRASQRGNIVTSQLSAFLSASFLSFLPSSDSFVGVSVTNGTHVLRTALLIYPSLASSVSPRFGFVAAVLLLKLMF